VSEGSHAPQATLRLRSDGKPALSPICLRSHLGKYLGEYLGAFSHWSSCARKAAAWRDAFIVESATELSSSAEYKSSTDRSLM